MKKILSTILGVFLAFSLFIIPNVLLAQQSSDVGINTDKPECLMGMGQDCVEYEKIIGIKDYQPGSGYTATSIAQDVVVSATYAVGTILTIVIIVCGLGYIFSSASGKETSKYRKGLVSAAIGAILVRGAYAIVRLVQYIARG